MLGTFVKHFARPTTPRARGRRPALAVEALDARITPSVDQVYDPTGASPIVGAGLGSINTDQQRAQTFEVGKTGVLTEVDVYVYRFFNTEHGDLILDIRGTQADGRPTSDADQVLLTTTLPATSVPVQKDGFVPFDISSFNLQVT